MACQTGGVPHLWEYLIRCFTHSTIQILWHSTSAVDSVFFVLHLPLCIHVPVLLVCESDQEVVTRPFYPMVSRRLRDKGVEKGGAVKATKVE